MAAHVQATGSTVNPYALDDKVVIVTGAGSGMGLPSHEPFWATAPRLWPSVADPSR